MKVIAFIPVRGGSKSIPLKNIKLFCGKPLVCWCIEALEQCPDVNEIVVATDSPEIERVVSSYPYKKVVVYHRSADSASDTASTECVMLEYINYAKLPAETTFMLVQATSPLTETKHFSEALRMYERRGPMDSLLSCVRNYRFFWNEDGTSMNYDYKHRPRRQDFDGMLMENGAIYINSVRNVLETGNRLSGKIMVYEMPEYTGMEIDEPDDWMILENLMRKHILSKHPSSKHSVKLFLSDVDGTLTDGGMYYSENGDELKKFNTRDGMGFQLLRGAGIKTGIITSEDTQIVTRRVAKLKVDYLVQGKRDGGKLAAVQDICNELGISLQEVAYIGDDVNCLELLSNVGFPACPADACAEVKAINGIMMMVQRGGEGCVREFVSLIMSNN